MKVSVLVPVYGVEKYIAQCAESLFSQTYKDIEFIFVNDCTPDKSIEVLQSVMDKYPERRDEVHIVNHEYNRGSGAARITALENATGDFVAFVDSDDLVPAEAIESLVKRQAETDADMVDGAADCYDNGKFSNTQLPYKGTHYIELLIIQNVLPHPVWGRLIRRSIFAKYNVNFTEGINQAEDYSLMPRIVYYVKRAWTDNIVYHYRVDRQGTFTDGVSHKHVKSYLGANSIIYNFFKDKDRKYHYPLCVGLINASYHAVKAGKTIREVNAALEYKPQGWLFKLSNVLLSHKSTVELARLEFLVLKRLYLWSLH